MQERTILESQIEPTLGRWKRTFSGKCLSLIGVNISQIMSYQSRKWPLMTLFNWCLKCIFLDTWYIIYLIFYWYQYVQNAHAAWVMLNTICEKSLLVKPQFTMDLNWEIAELNCITDILILRFDECQKLAARALCYNLPVYQWRKQSEKILKSLLSNKRRHHGHSLWYKVSKKQ